MATTAGPAETATSTSTTSTGTEELSGQEQQATQQPTGETPGQEQQQASTPEKLPDDHPLVKTLATQKSELAALKTELTEARAKGAKATELEEALTKRPTPEALATLQTRYDRLEEFTQTVGVGKALDSRTFTRDLFETDKPVADLVKEWNRANPTATSQALSSAAGTTGGSSSKQDPNKLIRAAFSGSKN